MEKNKFWRKSPKLSRSFGEFSKTFGKIFNLQYSKKIKQNGEKKVLEKISKTIKKFWRILQNSEE